MLKEIYTTRELVLLLKLVKTSILRRAERESWERSVRPERGGGNLWLFSSMPESTQLEIKAAVAREAENLPVPTVPAVVTDIFIPDYAWNRGRAKFRIVHEWNVFVAKTASKGITTAEATDNFLACLRSGLLIPEDVVKAAGSLSVPTLYRWKATLKRCGEDLEVLADKRGGWLNGKPKEQGRISEEAEKGFLAVYLKPNQPSMQFAYRAMAAHINKLGEPVPSYATVRRFFKRWAKTNDDIVTWMREGEKAYMDKVGPYISRDDAYLSVGQILVADGHKLNFWVQNPETGKGCRMTLIGWQDWKSRVFVGFDVMLNETTQAISSSLFRAIINLGMKPGVVLIDNGKAFKNKFFDGSDIEENNGLYARIGIGVQHSMPYVARTKVIERWWGDFDRQCEVSLPSYTGASIEDKPAHMQRNEKWHKAQHAKVATLPTVADVVRIVTEYAKWKALQPHPVIKTKTQWEIFSEGRGPGFSVEEADALSRHFLYRQQVNPSRCRVRLMGIDFESDALHGIKKPLMAHYSYTNLSEIYLYDEGRLLCTAKPVESVHPLAAVYGSDLDVDKVKAAQKRTATLRSDTRKMASDLADWGASSEALNSMPWMLPASKRRVPITFPTERKSLPEADKKPVITEEEAAAIMAITEAAKAQNANKPEYSCPSFFGSRAEKYEFLFDVQYAQGKSLTDEHADFMKEFEESEEYTAMSRRYVQLRNFYSKKGKAI